MPGVTIVTYALMPVLGLPLHAPRFTVLASLAMFVAFVIAALGEELGWSGYVIDRVQARWNALGAALLVGLVWAVWHWVPLMQAHRPIAWIAWWSLGTVALRVLIVWLYNNTGRSVPRRCFTRRPTSTALHLPATTTRASPVRSWRSWLRSLPLPGGRTG
jgi:membrane protease YdiL (CAAX protease family)